MSQQQTSPNKESRPKSRALADPPTDGITCLSYLKVKTSYLASTSWDGAVRIHDTSGEGLLRCSHAMESGPLLSLATSANENSLYAGGLDGSIQQFDVETVQVTTIGHHSPTLKESAVACSCLSTLDNSTVASAGWDSKFHVWDIRTSGTSKPAVSLDLPDKAFSMDASGELVVISTAKQNTCFIDIRKQNVVLQRESSLKHQTRVVRFFPDGRGIAVGSIEGRVAIEFLEELGIDSGGKKKYAFKCHRVGEVVYPVNAIAFHPRYGTFATGGCDGLVVTWDGLHKKKIATLPKFPTSIAALAFNHDGSELAIASSYTFEEGDREHPRDEIYIRSMLDSECKPKSMK